MKKTTNISIELSIYWDSFDIDKLTKILSISPTEIWIKWDNNTNKLISKKRLETNWSYSLWKKYTPFFDELTMEFIKVFDSKIDIINKFVKENNLSVKISSVINIVNWITPSLFFNKEFIEFIYQLNSEVDIDMYVL